MNVYDPKTVFSSIDKRGRYCFGNQPFIGRWNLSVLADALLPLIDDDPDKAIEMASEVLEEYIPLYEQTYDAMMGKKLGLETVEKEDKELFLALLELMHTQGLDYTNTFALLGLEDHAPFIASGNGLKEWYVRWEKRVDDTTKAKALMRSYNPRVIPRNHLVEEVLLACQEGNAKPFYTLLEMLKTPYDSDKALQSIPCGFDERYKTFCGT